MDFSGVKSAMFGHFLQKILVNDLKTHFLELVTKTMTKSIELEVDLFLTWDHLLGSVCRVGCTQFCNNGSVGGLIAKGLRCA